MIDFEWFGLFRAAQTILFLDSYFVTNKKPATKHWAGQNLTY